MLLLHDAPDLRSFHSFPTGFGGPPDGWGRRGVPTRATQAETAMHNSHVRLRWCRLYRGFSGEELHLLH